MPTPTRHCQTRTIEQVGMNQAAAADKVDHFSPFIIHVSLMLLGKIGKKKERKRWRDRGDHPKGTKSIRVTVRCREVEVEARESIEQTHSSLTDTLPFSSFHFFWLLIVLLNLDYSVDKLSSR